LITAFLIALSYDIFIKMLNALMLSINTFTTLGFGEIPQGLTALLGNCGRLYRLVYADDI